MKNITRIAGLTALLALFAFAGVGCMSGGDDEVKPTAGSKASDNPSVGQPVTSGGTTSTDEGGMSSGKGGPGGPKGGR